MAERASTAQPRSGNDGAARGGDASRAAPHVAAAPHAGSAPAAPPADARRVLVVEDDPDLCSILCALLVTQGYRAEPAHDGPTAVRQVEAEKPDAVVLDAMIPGLDGFEVCRKLKFSRETNLIPILMLTALDSKEARTRGLRVGADRYLIKPFEPEALFRELRGTIDHRRRLIAGNVRTAIELHMQSDSRYREQLNDLLSELFVLTPLSEQDAGRIRYAVLEMTQNAIEWGNRRKDDLTVTITYEVTDEALKFVITDQGPGFNPAHLPHAACDDDPVSHMCIREQLGLRDGGFGILITKGMVDEVKYNDAGNQVTLIKHFRRAHRGKAGGDGA
jgi:DNA-binding response OmpR family regulator